MIDFNNATLVKLKKTSDNSVIKDVSPLFVNGEQILGVYKGIRDYVAFTTHRILAVNVQGLTGKKKDFTSIPYSKIQTFSVETAGTFDLDSELEIYVSGVGKCKFEFSGASDILEIGRKIGEFVL